MGLFNLLRTLVLGPSPELMAAQLRKPSGAASSRVAAKMNEVNAELYAVVLQAMELPANAQVLELGPGNGRTSKPFFDRYPTAHYTGLDYSAEMVTAAGKSLAAHIAVGRAELIQGTSDTLPFRNDRFDVVFGVNTIYFWDDVAAHLKEIRRVLKPGGRLVTGYRDKESMKNLPFTQHGFTMYAVNEWERVLLEADFSWVKSTVQAEPERVWQGHRFAVNSCCTVAQV